MRYPDPLLKLIAIFKKLPGVGAKTAERFAFHLLDWPEERQVEMGRIIQETKNLLKLCATCGCLIEATSCPWCDKNRRNQKIICLVASPKDVFAIEETGSYRGLYHVLGGLLSPLQQRGPSQQALQRLKTRISEDQIEEVIMALDSTLEGDATALFLKKELASLPVSISRLALGLPMGSSLDYIDGGTLSRALAGRHTY